jgi:uncharacterized protein (DUF433 family)
MWARLEKWQFDQLVRLSAQDFERAETLLNTLWNAYPGLYAELTIRAVDQEQLTVDEAAARLDVSIEEIEASLVQFRRSIPIEGAVVCEGEKLVARLVQGQLPVWEVVREYRKVGSVEKLKVSFPSLSESELAAALRYAQSNSTEIEAQIADYERYLEMRRGAAHSQAS